MSQSRESRRVRSWLRKGVFDAMILSGIKESSIHHYVKDVDEFTVEPIVNHIKMMQTTCQDLINLWGEHTEETWNALFQRHKFTQFPEIIKLNKLKKEVKRQWHLRPRLK